MKLSVNQLASKQKLSRWLLIIGVLWFLAAVFFWFTKVYASPENVFNGMIQNNFTTQGYTRITSNETNGVKQSEISQVQYGLEPVANTKLTIENGGLTQVAEVLSTPDKDFVRYTTFEYLDAKGKKTNMTDAEGKWAVQDVNGNLSQSFQRLVFLASYFPMTNVSTEKRQELLQYVENNPVYTPNFDKVKSENQNGRAVYTYEVEVRLQDFAELVIKLGNAAGMGDKLAGINPEDYAKSEPVQLKVSIDKLAKQLVRVQYPGNEAVNERYDGYGINQKVVTLPEKPISTLELQQIIQKSTAAQQ